MEIYLGIMSGTSLDGVDVVAAEVDSTSTTLIQCLALPFPDDLKSTLLAISQNKPLSISTFGELDHRLGLLYADAVNQLLAQASIPPSAVTAIGCHGQTVFHAPQGRFPFTLQLGDANIIAARTGITTVADFRRKDMALGGQGAPLVPAFHHYLFGQSPGTTVVLNVGGIANISVLQLDKPVTGYDTGPGNMLMDSWITRCLGQRFDTDGRWAKSGRCRPEFLKLLMLEPYFSLPAPKSTGRELFNADWLDTKLDEFQNLNGSISQEDVQATLLAFTAQTIADALVSYPCGELLVCGGGARNLSLLEALSEKLPAWKVNTTKSRGVDPDYMEALAFAWLARQAIHKQPGNLPDVTGASRLCQLGAIYPAP